MQHQKILLGVNIDHVATLRQARGTHYPDPVQAALLAEKAGADGITLHLREDRRHIQDRDVFELKNRLQTRMNFEMAVTEEMLQIAEKVHPSFCCLVPEKRQELTTEGGLDVRNNFALIKTACDRLATNTIKVSLFIDPDLDQIDSAHKTGASFIELHTGCYAEAADEKTRVVELQRIEKAANHAANLGLTVNAGHGLHYQNTQAIAAIPVIYELNIGHAIVAESIFVGFEAAVAKMKNLMIQARKKGLSTNEIFTS